MDNFIIKFSNLEPVLGKLAGVNRFLIAFSGGMDSTALLHLMSENRHSIKPEITAVHVNHQISKRSSEWSAHCNKICKSIGVPLKQLTVDANNYSGAGPEAHARFLRYKVISENMIKNDVLLTAHHQDDLAETLLLQLLRGAGPQGLAGMPVLRDFGPGKLARPFLNFSRSQIETYAREKNLVWIEDDSNTDQKIERNFIRKKVIPCMEERWTAAKRTIARSANHQSDAIKIMNDMGKLDFEKTKGESLNTIVITELNELSTSRKRNLIRYWLKLNNHPVPNSHTLNNILFEIVMADKDRMPLIQWGNTQIRRYRNQLYVMNTIKKIVKKNYHWNLMESLDLETGRLEAKQITGQGIRAESIFNNTIDVRFRIGGEKIQPAGRSEVHSLKKMFQEIGLPPWERERVPLLYIKGQLAAVVDYWIDDRFSVGISEPGWDIRLINH